MGCNPSDNGLPPKIVTLWFITVVKWQLWGSNENNVMLGVTATWGAESKGRSLRKAESHCCNQSHLATAGDSRTRQSWWKNFSVYTEELSNIKLKDHQTSHHTGPSLSAHGLGVEPALVIHEQWKCSNRICIKREDFSSWLSPKDTM